MSPYKLLIFDFDGTLCATLPAITHCFEQTFAQFGHPIPSRETLAQTVSLGFGLDESFQELGATQPHSKSSERDKWSGAYRAHYSRDGNDMAFLFAGTEDLLRRATRAGHTLCILSNKNEAAVRFSLEKFGIGDLFHLVVGAAPGLLKKPDPQTYHDVIKPAFPNIRPEATLMIGDTAADLAYARAAGIPGCWAAYGYGLRSACLNESPAHTLDSVEDLAVILALPESL